MEQVAEEEDLAAAAREHRAEVEARPKPSTRVAIVWTIFSVND
jgi:hypothetical protein